MGQFGTQGLQDGLRGLEVRVRHPHGDHPAGELGPLEAVAAGVPVIAAHIGGIPEILPADSMFPAENTNALAQLLALSLATPNSLQAKANSLVTIARSKFGAKNMADQVTSFYKSLI